MAIIVPCVVFSAKRSHYLKPGPVLPHSVEAQRVASAARDPDDKAPGRRGRGRESKVSRGPHRALLPARAVTHTQRNSRPFYPPDPCGSLRSAGSREPP